MTKIEALLSGPGLIDRCRKSTGKGGFTRHDEPNKMHARIDRIYTPPDVELDLDDDDDAENSNGPPAHTLQ